MNLKTAIALLSFAVSASNTALAADAVEVVESGSVPAGAINVDITKMKYQPATIEVDAGSTITWTNHDAVPHNVYLQVPVEVVGEMLRAGQSLALRFNEPGDYSYICSPHPFMKGKVSVKPKS